MLTEYVVKRGFGPNRTKEYFVGQKDGDTLAGVIAGPFESYAQCYEVIEALKPLYDRGLVPLAGHLTKWFPNWQTIGDASAQDS